MVSIELLQYDNNQESIWDAFIEKSWNGTFLHSRRFLSYHGDRFKDCSLMIIEEETQKLLGVFPLAENLNDATVIVSHPGITYGGVIHQGGLRGELLIHCFSEVKEYFAQRAYKRLQYKATPLFYHKIPTCDDVYAMFRLNFQRYRCDLSATIDLTNRPRITKGRKSGLSKARRFGIRIDSGVDFLLPFWEVLYQNLAEKFGTKPVHTLKEIQLLCSLFPGKTKCVVAVDSNDEVIAGTLLFITDTAVHTQYIAGNQAGHETGALDMVIEYTIQFAQSLQVRYFDFGINTEQDGLYLNSGLYFYKTSFGAGATVHEFYQTSL